MKKHPRIGVASLLLMIVAMAAGQLPDAMEQSQSRPSNQPGPLCGADQTFADLGMQPYFRPFFYQFEIKNLGNAPLALDIRSRSCACTYAQLSVGTLAPGEKGWVRLGYRPQNESDTVGKRSFSAVVVTNDATHSELPFKVVATLARDVTCEPATLFLRDSEVRGTFKEDLRLHCVGNEPAKITSLEGSVPMLTARLLKETQNSWGHELLYEVKLTEYSAQQNQPLFLRASTTSLRQPLVEIPVVVQPDVETLTKTRTLLLGVVSPGMKVTRLLTLPVPEQVNALQITSSDPRLRVKAKIVSQPDGRRLVQVETAADTQASPGEIRTNLNIQGVAGGFSTQVRVVGYLAPAGS